VACLGDRANIYRKTNRGVEALENVRRGIAISDSLVQRFPVVPEYMEVLAGMHNSLCNLLRGQSEFDAALEAIARSIALYESLVNDHPDVSDYRNALGAAWHNKGQVLQVQEKHEQAVECFYNAIAQQQQVFKIAPQNRRYRTFLGAHYQSLAQSLRSLGKAIEAADATRELIALWPNDPSELYDGACWLSLCLPLLPDGTPADQREALAAEAVATLKLAIQAGWSDANQISKDSDLDPVREREDFQRALSEIDDDEEKSAR
jgi:tetratricopeptide (TPR) repeat protein